MLCLDSRRIQPGDIFVALKGALQDGRFYISQAIEKGAIAVLMEGDGQILMQGEIPLYTYPQLRKRLGVLASEFYGDPSASLKVIAVTGTNGKTSVAQLLAQALHFLAEPCATIGTLGVGVTGQGPLKYEGGLTTPDAAQLQHHFADFLEAGVTSVALEASSHALDQGRLNGTHIHTAIFTNLTQDHLDYHTTMARYGLAKASLFEWPSLKQAIMNIDDYYGAILASALKTPAVQLFTFGHQARADVRIVRAQYQATGLEALVQTPWGMLELQSQLLGEINLYNLLPVVAYLGSQGIPLGIIAGLLPHLKPIVGRLERLGGHAGQPMVFVDFAHTPDAIEKVLSLLRTVCRGRLWCVMGCGGDRDSSKRPLMAQAAAKADRLILTSDNPRSEDPQKIIQDMQAGLPTGSRHRVMILREQAIYHAVQHAAAEDIVLVAGRGHETYQVISGKKYHFDDRSCVAAALKGEPYEVKAC